MEIENELATRVYWKSVSKYGDCPVAYKQVGGVGGNERTTDMGMEDNWGGADANQQSAFVLGELHENDDYVHQRTGRNQKGNG